MQNTQNTAPAATLEPSSPPWITVWKDLSAAGASTLTVVSLIVAGIVSLRYYRNRFPRARVTHILHNWPADGRTMVRGVVRVENVGSVIIELGSIQGVLTQILPLPADVSEALQRGEAALDGNATEILWETLHDRCRDFSEDSCEIEPGETDEFPFDFVIPQTARKVQFYSHVANVKKRKRNVGWNTSTILDLEDAQENKHVIPHRTGQTETGEATVSVTPEEAVGFRE